MSNSAKIAQKFSITVGNLLYRKFFPLYNILYPRFKMRQDAEEIEFLKRTIKKGDTVLDIGANIGFYSKLLAGLTGESGKVYSFEPDAANYNYLLRNTKGIKNIIPINKAVSESSGILQLYTSTTLMYWLNIN
jgi:fibrillarin-like rRNA methylase